MKKLSTIAIYFASLALTEYLILEILGKNPNLPAFLAYVPLSNLPFISFIVSLDQKFDSKVLRYIFALLSNVLLVVISWLAYGFSYFEVTGKYIRLGNLDEYSTLTKYLLISWPIAAFTINILYSRAKRIRMHSSQFLCNIFSFLSLTFCILITIDNMFYWLK